ncbi:MAG: SDR family oxidoreductase [Candidatus Binatus sp.]|uniref:SDR family NAD(P)-dependent oxidoreductase n=1 Tax=Candidatus Binatus sp. TaxID=2811406 RepID=UPI00271FFFAB|nr:SDR family oxidoreductase [Candidatus Binatus sp.]MDO8434604.1 SDR family oxidoreductase [Candidatus Binatus sp.]
MDPKGKVALITGGARIGQVVAQALAARGCALAMLYRSSRDAAERTVAAARNEGVEAIAIQADATNEAQVAAAVAETRQNFGRLDILINMASTYVKTPAPSAKDWSLAMDSNATSAFMFSVQAAPVMKAGGGGRIINFTDWLAVSRRARYHDYVPYYSSKAAVIGLTESLALDLAPDILVNAIAPGPILPPPDLTPAEHNRVIAATPLARWGGGEEIAKAVLFLIETEFVTGECIRVDGGRHLS